MKELYVLSGKYLPSTAGTNHMMAYVKGLAENGVHVTLFFLRPSERREKCIEQIDNVDFVYLWDDRKYKNKLWDSLVTLKRFFFMMKPDIPVWVLGCPDELCILKFKRGIKIYQERTENPNKIKGPLNFWYKKIISKLEGVVVITPSLRELFIEEFGVNPDKIIVANMVVDEKRFSNLENNTPSHTIGYCGTISEWKDGVSYLVKAFGIVHNKHPEYKLILMGGFENEATKELIFSMVNEYNIQDNVVFTGVVKNEEMPQRLKDCEILALARPKQKEKAFGFATKIGEYLLTERPVVMTDVGDATYYLRDKENVVFAKPNDEVDFAEKLLWVIEHKKETSLIGKNGLKQALKEFNYMTEAKKIVNFIFNE